MGKKKKSARVHTTIVCHRRRIVRGTGPLGRYVGTVWEPMHPGTRQVWLSVASLPPLFSRLCSLTLKGRPLGPPETLSRIPQRRRPQQKCWRDWVEYRPEASQTGWIMMEPSWSHVNRYAPGLYGWVDSRSILSILFQRARAWRLRVTSREGCHEAASVSTT